MENQTVVVVIPLAAPRRTKTFDSQKSAILEYPFLYNANIVGDLPETIKMLNEHGDEFLILRRQVICNNEITDDESIAELERRERESIAELDDDLDFDGSERILYFPDRNSFNGFE